jgi:hypothetical protein
MGKFRLVNLRASGLIGSYETEDDALREVAESIRYHHGDLKVTRNIALQVDDPSGPGDRPLAEGLALGRRALDRFPEAESRRRSA